MLRFIPAPEPLAPWVLGVSVLRAQRDQVVTVPAHALAVFTLVYRGSAHAAAHVLASTGVLTGAGSSTQATTLLARAGTVCASVLCRASILPLLTGESAGAFADAPVPPELLSLDAARFQDELGPGASDEELARALLAPVQQQLLAARAPRTSSTRFALALAGWRPTEQVRPPTDWSPRQWQRACIAELGVTPKFLQRLHRLHASVRHQLAQNAESLSQQALHAGFFDQAHMAREYRLLVGIRPQQTQKPDVSRAAVLGSSQLAPRFFG